MEFKSFMEALKGKQHKIDKNKNGEIDAHDFKLLRKEESEETIEESEERMARADYKVGPSGRKSHKEIVFKDAESKDDDEEKEDMKEAKMSDEDMAERERLVKGMKKNLAGFKARYGERAKEVMYATATKQAMKEGYDSPLDTPEQKKAREELKKTLLDIKKTNPKHPAVQDVKETVQKADIPAYLRKQQGQTPLKMSDLKRKDTISDKENLAKLRNEETKYVVHYTNEKGEHVNSSKAFDDKAAADEHASKGNAMDKVGGKYTVKAMQNEQKQDVPFDGPYTKTKPAKNSDGTTQSPMSRARELAKQAMKQKMKEEFDIDMSDEQADSILECIAEQAPVAPVPDKKYIKGTPEHKAYKATKKPINGMPTNKMSCEETSLDEVEKKTLSYGDFVSNLLEYETKDGRYVHKGTYGGSYTDPEGADDADDKKPKQQPAEKRGRGRPAGAKSGARKITGTSKLFK